MTKTNAKKGMIQYKTGHSKDAFDFDYVQHANYNETHTVYDIIAILRKQDVEQRQAHEQLGETVDELKKQNTELIAHIKVLEAKLTDVETKYYEALKGVLQR